jgi:hypothetical protein
MNTTVENTEKKGKCKSCKKDKLNAKEIFFVIIGLYMFATSIYGTIQLFKNLFN